LVILDCEPWLVAPTHSAHFRAQYVDRNEAHDDAGRCMFDNELLRAQDDLIEAVPRHSAIQHAATGKILQLRGPSFLVKYLVPISKTVANGQ
jgi:hypothetical protein